MVRQNNLCQPSKILRLSGTPCLHGSGWMPKSLAGWKTVKACGGWYDPFCNAAGGREQQGSERF